ncbi:hypothetical protein ACWEKJ_38485 [Amycolatopsis thermoflava]
MSTRHFRAACRAEVANQPEREQAADPMRWGLFLQVNRWGRVRSRTGDLPLLLILEVPDRGHHGWSTVSMKARYMHVTDEICRDVANQIDGYSWKKLNREDL